MISFLIPFLLINKRKKELEENEDKKILDIDQFIHSKLINAIFIINLVIVIFYKIKYEIIIKDLPTYEVRLARFESLFGSAFENLFFNYIVVGLVSIAAILLSIMLINRKVKNVLFGVCGATIIIYSLIGYGRMMFLNVAIYIIISLLMQYNVKELLNKRNILKLIIIVIVFIVIFTAMLYVRTYNKNLTIGENIANAFSSQTKQAITYVTGGLRMLDNFIDNGFQAVNGYTFGRATLAGFEEIILYPLKGIGLEIASYNNIISETTQEYAIIGENDIKFNAFYTCVMNFYSDFGFLGVIIFPMIYALFMVWVFNNYKKRKNMSAFLLLNYSTMNLIFGIVRWNLQIGSSAFVLILLIVLNLYNIWKEKKNKNEVVKEHGNVNKEDKIPSRKKCEISKKS